MQEYVIFELDGCLVETAGISGLMGDWDAHAEACLSCPPIEHTVLLARRMQACAEILIVSSRPQQHYQQSLDWLALQGLIPEQLFMRPQFNMAPEAELYPAQLQAFYGPEWQGLILAAVTGKAKQAEAWRAIGIPALETGPLIRPGG